MDQLRKALGWFKRQHFWVLSVVVAFLAIGCWWSAAGTLQREYKTNESEIKSQHTSLDGVKNKAFLPNDEVNNKQIEETNKQGADVLKTWQQLYDRQREQVLEWPATLSPAFLQKIETLKFGDEIKPQELLENYQNYAQRYFPELPKIVGARPLSEEQMTTSAGAGSGYGRGGGEGFARGAYGDGATAFGMQAPDDDDYICQWVEQDQMVIREKLTFLQLPSHWRVWVTQEDLWVYKALLSAIRNTNAAAGATRMSNAAVRVIQSLEVGERAAGSSIASGRIYQVPMAAVADPAAMGADGAAAGAEGTGGYAGYDASAAGGEVGMPMGGRGDYGATGEGAMTPEMEMAMLLSYRYLGPDGNPQPVGGGGGDPSMAADPTMTADPAASASGAPDLGTEYKRLPVRMSLVMDQRWLTRLITECANQPLQIEVQQVRVNPPDFGTGGSEGMGGLGGGGYGGGGYGGGGYGRGGGGRTGYGDSGGRSGEGGGYGGAGMFGGSASNLFPERSGIQQFSANPHQVQVVIQGIIYIFEEPDESKLKTATDDTQLAMVPE